MVRVAVLSSPPRQPFLEFILYFDDGYQKHYSMDHYALMTFRGLRESDIIEEQARIYFEDCNEPCDVINLVFL